MNGYGQMTNTSGYELTFNETVNTRKYAVTGVDDIDVTAAIIAAGGGKISPTGYPRRRQVIRPTSVVVRAHDGIVHSVSVVGPRVRLDGTLGQDDQISYPCWYNTPEPPWLVALRVAEGITYHKPERGVASARSVVDDQGSRGVNR
jgi:hypothetical protein